MNLYLKRSAPLFFVVMVLVFISDSLSAQEPLKPLERPSGVHRSSNLASRQRGRGPCTVARGNANPCERPTAIHMIFDDVRDCLVVGGEVMVMVITEDGTYRRWNYPWDENSVRFCGQSGHAIAAPPKAVRNSANSASAAPKKRSGDTGDQNSAPQFNAYWSGSYFLVDATNNNSRSFSCSLSIEFTYEDYGETKTENKSVAFGVPSNHRGNVVTLRGTYVNPRNISEPSVQCN